MAASNLEIIYWPAVGRTLGPRLILEDASIPYKRTMWMGQGELPPTVVATPCIVVDGEAISQTMAIMEVVADHAGVRPPSSQDDKSRQTMLNLHDIDEQAINKRNTDKAMTMEDCAEFTNSRVKQFMVAVEAAYGAQSGPYFCGSRVTMVDFQLASTILKLNTVLGAVNVMKMLKTSAPSLVVAFNGMMARPNIRKWVDGGFSGEPLSPATMPHILASNTAWASGKLKVFMKAGCPFCSKLAAFLGEAQLMHKVSFEPDDDVARHAVKAACGKVSFPAFEYEPGKFMLESDDIINKFAQDNNVDISKLKAFNFVFSMEAPSMMKNFTKMFKLGLKNAGGFPQLFEELDKQ